MKEWIRKHTWPGWIFFAIVMIVAGIFSSNAHAKLEPTIVTVIGVLGIMAIVASCYTSIVKEETEWQRHFREKGGDECTRMNDHSS